MRNRIMTLVRMNWVKEMLASVAVMFCLTVAAPTITHSVDATDFIKEKYAVSTLGEYLDAVEEKDTGLIEHHTTAVITLFARYVFPPIFELDTVNVWLKSPENVADKE